MSLACNKHTPSSFKLLKWNAVFLAKHFTRGANFIADWFSKHFKRSLQDMGGAFDSLRGVLRLGSTSACCPGVVSYYTRSDRKKYFPLSCHMFSCASLGCLHATWNDPASAHTNNRVAHTQTSQDYSTSSATDDPHTSTWYMPTSVRAYHTRNHTSSLFVTMANNCTVKRVALACKPRAHYSHKQVDCTTQMVSHTRTNNS